MLNNTIAPVRNFIMPMVVAAATVVPSMMATSCDKDNEVTIADGIFIPNTQPLPLNVDSTLKSKIDSLYAVNAYKIDSVNNASGDQDVIDSLKCDLYEKLQNLSGDN